MQKMASKKRLICRRGAFTWGACGLSDRLCCREHEPYTQNYSALTMATDFSLGGEDRYFDKLQKDEENVLLFWGSWCPHCESLIERIDQLDSADAIKKNLFTVAEDESLDDVEGH